MQSCHGTRSLIRFANMMSLMLDRAFTLVHCMETGRGQETLLTVSLSTLILVAHSYAGLAVSECGRASWSVFWCNSSAACDWVINPVALALRMRSHAFSLCTFFYSFTKGGKNVKACLVGWKDLQNIFLYLTRSPNVPAQHFCLSQVLSMFPGLGSPLPLSFADVCKV